MRVTLTVQDLIDFEREVTSKFEAKQIPYPVHLSGGNERQMIEVFERHVGPDDWVCCSWRAHFHALLKGVPREQVMAAVVGGHSIALCFPEYRVIGSAIVGGMAPVAVGLAVGIKRKGEHEAGRDPSVGHTRNPRKVVCFVGDMAWESGGVQEAYKYARNHFLPLLWVVENNGCSAGADTREVWGLGGRLCLPKPNTVEQLATYHVEYSYENTYPHCGIGRHVNF